MTNTPPKEAICAVSDRVVTIARLSPMRPRSQRSTKGNTMTDYTVIAVTFIAVMIFWIIIGEMKW